MKQKIKISKMVPKKFGNEELAANNFIKKLTNKSYPQISQVKNIVQKFYQKIFNSKCT